ncbi:DUF4876 domain-containing protein [Kaistella rhinocerotis]|uniref:DUF4876 domain-containing protein n=1 Tax=Kaistella rhinocerotis TaxID=3026437 RepID=UPI0025522416|nr:DUF4876 domain-containing protein [Kaistella sp. Ran72]
MKKRFLIFGLLAAMATTVTVSCSRDDDGFGSGAVVAQKSNLTVTLSGKDISSYKNVAVEIQEVNTGAITKYNFVNQSAHTFDLPYGSYKVVANGEAIMVSLDEVQVGGTANVDINTATSNVLVNLQIKQFSQDFLIEEVFFTGVKTPDNKNYNNSRYFKLVNNTDKVLYADNLIISGSEFFTTVKRVITPYNVEEYFPISNMMVLTGSGTQYPVQPGDFIVVADNAIDHTASNGFDLRNADFEFPSSNPSLGHVDNPAVPNAAVVYTKMSFNMIFLYTTSQEAYVIARFPAGENPATFIQNYKYTYSYTNSAGNTTTVNSYKIPNSWIVDAVNTSRDADFQHIITGASLDAGYTSASPGYSGKTVRRKVLGQTANGKNIYKDTNNSASDFTRDSQSSLINGIIR